MTPPPNHHPCQGCALEQARGGRVCPAARDLGLPDVEVQRHAQALHAAILADAGRTPGFAELVRRDAMSRTAALPVSISLGLLTAPALAPSFPDSRKEAIRAALPPRTSR
jgi:hypothetical protein